MVVGDSAFGFSGMELETAARYSLPLKVIIINNSGIQVGVEEIEKGGEVNDISPSALSPNTQYEMISHALGGKGKEVKTPEELETSLQEMLSDDNLWVLNVRIDPYASAKPATFSWLTSSADVKKPTAAASGAKL